MTAAEFREWMRANGWSNRKLAKALGVSRATIERRRSGEVRISHESEWALHFVEVMQGTFTGRR